MTPVYPFEFTTAGRIIFGPGVLASALNQVGAYGQRPLVVCGRDVDRCRRHLLSLEVKGLSLTFFSVTGEPQTTTIEEGVQLARRADCDMVLSMGGGSAIDTAKAIAVLLNNTGKLIDYLEVIGRGRSLENLGAPCIAIPTTAGTGAEVTRNAVLTSEKHRVKVSLRSSHMLPRVVIVDPQLLLTLPPHLTAATGMDALTQLIEAFVSSKANPMTDGMCREGLRRGARSLVEAYRNGDNLAARTDMALASLFSGLALANAGLGAVHGIAGPLGGWTAIPHGVVCATLLATVFEANAKYVAQQQPDNPVRKRFDEVARLLTGKASATADDAVIWLKRLQHTLHIPTLSELSLTAADVPAVARKALKASSMKGNPAPLSESDIVQILEQAMAHED